MSPLLLAYHIDLFDFSKWRASQTEHILGVNIPDAKDRRKTFHYKGEENLNLFSSNNILYCVCWLSCLPFRCHAKALYVHTHTNIFTYIITLLSCGHNKYLQLSYENIERQETNPRSHLRTVRTVQPFEFRVKRVRVYDNTTVHEFWLFLFTCNTLVKSFIIKSKLEICQEFYIYVALGIETYQKLY